MDESLHPAVRDIAAVGALSAVAGAVVIALGFVVDPPGGVLANLAVFLVATVVVAPLRTPAGLKALRQIVDELRAAPEAAIDEGLGRPVWWTVPFLAALVLVAALLSLPAALCGAVLFATGGWELAQAAWLRRYERLNGTRLLYRPVYRWTGTNGRALGRGWFDPANFVAA